MSEHHLPRTPAQVAAAMDRLLNGGLEGEQRRTGYVLLTFPFHVTSGTLIQYTANTHMAQAREALAAMVAMIDDRLNPPAPPPAQQN